jgi:hypothetical protein
MWSAGQERQVLKKKRVRHPFGKTPRRLGSNKTFGFEHDFFPFGFAQGLS